MPGRVPGPAVTHSGVLARTSNMKGIAAMVPIPRNGQESWNALAEAVENIQRQVSEIAVRTAVIENRLDSNSCSDHKMETKSNTREIAKLQFSGAVMATRIGLMSAVVGAAAAVATQYIVGRLG